jgi:hypothetical protein
MRNMNPDENPMFICVAHAACFGALQVFGFVVLRRDVDLDDWGRQTRPDDIYMAKNPAS